MLSAKIVELLNRQIGLEFYSANLYLQMSAWCAYKGFEGCASFLRGHASEERIHMQKLFGYVEDCGGLPLLGAVPAPPAEFASVLEIFEKTLDHEIYITSKINELAGAALDERDFSTFNFLQWYVGEQHEEEKLFRTILDKFRLIGTEGRGAFYFDKEIRKFAPAAAGS